MNSSRERVPLPKRLSSSQVPLMASHISTVRAVRTARALPRAISKQLRMEEGLALEKQRKSVTVSSLASGYKTENACAQPAVASADSHSLDEPAYDNGSVVNRWVTSRMRARYSARST